MNLFQDYENRQQDTQSIKAIKKSISKELNPFDLIRLRMIDELKKQ